MPASQHTRTKGEGLRRARRERDQRKAEQRRLDAETAQRSEFFLPELSLLFRSAILPSVQAEICRRFNQNYRHHLDLSFAVGIFEIVLAGSVLGGVHRAKRKPDLRVFLRIHLGSGSFFTGSSDPYLDYRRRRSFFDEHHNFIDPWPKNAELVHQHRRPCLAEDVDVVDIVRVQTCWRNPSPETEFLSKSLVFFELHHRSRAVATSSKDNIAPRKTNIAEVLTSPACRFGVVSAGEEEQSSRKLNSPAGS
ncbi:hypothetical protein Droror1_Dr00022998 [Drosera rotundifolia]